MRHGPSTMLMALASHSTRIATAASPAPRKMALMRNSITTDTLPPSITRVKLLPLRTTSGSAPISPSSCGAKTTPTTPSASETPSPSRSVCAAVCAAPSGSCSPVRRATIAIAPMPRPDGERVDEHHHRLGQADRGDGLLGPLADVPDDVDVPDDEDALHQHLQDHRDGEQEDGAADGAFGVVVLRVRAAHGLAHGREEPGLGLFWRGGCTTCVESGISRPASFFGSEEVLVVGCRLNRKAGP